MKKLWAAEWCSKNLLDGEERHLINRDSVPVLFRTRKRTREWIEAEYGYIRTRADLRKEPHGWSIPKAVKVIIVRQG